MTNGTGNITVTTPDIAGASNFDLLRVGIVTSGRNQAPFGTGNLAVATAVTRGAACASGVCTFTDTQAALQSYTVATPSYFPLLDFWPGALILGSNSDSSSVIAPARAYLDNTFDSIVSVLGTVAPSVIAARCEASDKWTPAWFSCYTSEVPSLEHEQSGFLLMAKPNQDGGTPLNLKGRLNFANVGTGPSHIMTLSDANFQKTIATANNRPSNDTNDAYIGYDQANGDPSQVGISFGAPKSLSNYIGNTGNGSSWLERLTATLKEFKTNVQMDSNLTLAGPVLTTGPWTTEGAFATMTAAGASKSKLGFGAAGKLQVSENGGAVFEVAKLDNSGNVSANANTATQLASAPTQCSGSFSTGIQSNGNANCSTPDVIQLAETTAPAGIPSFGLFWFDSTCHCPKVIDNNGQAIPLSGPFQSKWWSFPTGAGTGSFSASSGKATVYGVHLDFWWTFSKINYKVVGADTAGATYDLGLADHSGAVVCHIGNTAATTNFTGTGAHQLSLVSTCSGPPGDYYEVITCSATSGCATLTATSGNAMTNVATDVAITSAGTLSNFTAPADSWSWTATAPILGFQ